MQTFVVRTLRALASIIWVFFIVLFVFVEAVILIKVITGGYLQRDIGVNLKSVDALPAVSTDSVIVRFNQITSSEAKLKIDMKITAWTAPVVLAGFTVLAFLTLTIVFQVRKILRTIRQNAPFDYINIRRLRIISLSLFLIAVINFLSSLFDRHLLIKYGGDAANHYLAKIDFEITTVIAAMLILILSEIFRQGYALKTENEAFV